MHIHNLHMHVMVHACMLHVGVPMCMQADMRTDRHRYNATPLLRSLIYCRTWDVVGVLMRTDLPGRINNTSARFMDGQTKNTHRERERSTDNIEVRCGQADRPFSIVRIGFCLPEK